MALSIKASLLLFLLMLIYILSSDITEGLSDNNVNLVNSLDNDKGGVLIMNSRKLLGFDSVPLDYDYTGPNPRHDPRKGKPGNGGKNP